MAILKRKIQSSFGKHILWYVFLLWAGGAFTCFAETISYTSQPTTITVAFTGVLSTGKWLYFAKQAKKSETLLTYTLAKDRDFKEYVKNVTSHEWNRDLGRDEADEFLKTGAIAVKTRAWGIRNN